jgi:hypothetical protein
MRQEEVIVRDGAPVTAEVPSLLPPQSTDNGSIRLTWHRTAAADSYQILILDTGLNELARFDAGSDTFLILTEDRFESVPPPPDRQVLWQVLALRRGDKLGISRPGSLRLP